MQYSGDFQKRSYLFQPWKGPLPYCTIPERIQNYAMKSPNNDAVVIIEENNRIAVTYKELVEKGTEMAKKFAALGIKKGDIVAINDEKTPTWLYCTLGLQMCGGWPLHIFFMNKDGSDVLQVLQATRSKYLITNPGQNDCFTDIVQKITTVDENGKFASANLPDLQGVLFTKAPINVPNAMTVESLPFSNSLSSSIDPEDVAAIFCSSGTTGKPKLVPRTHTDLIRSNLANINGMGLQEGDAYFCERPFSWIGGYPLRIVNGIKHVTSTLLLELKTVQEHTTHVIDVLQKEHCSHAFLFPSVVADMLETKPAMNPIKTIVTGGGPISAKDAKILARYCEQFSNTYGSTESSSVSHNTARQYESLENFDVGVPFPGMEIKVIRADGSLADVGETGEVCHRGLYGTSGYLHEEQGWYSKNLIAGKWFKSGDAGYITEKGHLIVSGRVSDAIIVENHIIPPAFIETIYLRHPSVEDVVAFGIPHSQLHEVIGLAVTLKTGLKVTEDELKHYFNKEVNYVFIPQESRFMSGLIPQVVFLEEFPKTNSGKTARAAVKEIALKQVQMR